MLQESGLKKISQLELTLQTFGWITSEFESS